LYLQLPGQVLSLELLVLAYVGRNHPLHLLGSEEEPEAEVVHACGREGGRER